MFCCTLFSVHSSFAIILMGKRELVALLSLSSWCIVIVLALSWGLSAVCDCGISYSYSLTIYNDKMITFFTPEMRFQSNLNVI